MAGAGITLAVSVFSDSVFLPLLQATDSRLMMAKKNSYSFHKPVLPAVVQSINNSKIFLIEFYLKQFGPVLSGNKESFAGAVISNTV